MHQRAEARDYLDIDALLRDGRIDLPTALVSARGIYGRSSMRRSRSRRCPSSAMATSPDCLRRYRIAWPERPVK